MSKTPRLRGRAAQERRKRFLDINPLCVRCQDKGRVTAATELDHRVPLTHGGADDADNLRALCRPCHLAVTREQFGKRPKGCDRFGNPNGGWMA